MLGNMMKMNGGTVRYNGYTKWIALVGLLFLPALFVFNNLFFSVGYTDIIELKDDFIAAYEADDPRLIDHIRKHYIEPPADRSSPYVLNNPNGRDFSHKRQSSIVEEILEGQRNGFFIEAGGYDGETYSNSLYFEKFLNWTGILIEPDHANIVRLRQKNRKSWLVKSCLDGGTKPRKMRLMGAMDVGALDVHLSVTKRILTRLWRPTQVTEVWCFPLYSILLAMNRTKIDYFVLDVEGSEMPVLKSMPWDKLDIGILQVEYMVFRGAYWSRDDSRKRRKAMRDFFQEHLPNYKEHSVVFLDLIFVKDRMPKSNKSNLI